MNKWILKFGFGTVVVFALLTRLTAETTLPAGKCHSSGGQVAGAVVHTQGGETIVSGSVRRNAPMHQMSGAHVHVQLVGSKGQILATQVGRFAPVSPQRDVSTNYRSKYSVSFPAAQAGEVNSVKVAYHAESHAECRDCCTGKSCS